MAKSPEMERTLDTFAKAIFGRGRNEGVCVTCGSDRVKPEDFPDDISRKEYQISRMCYECQCSVFGA